MNRSPGSTMTGGSLTSSTVTVNAVEMVVKPHTSVALNLNSTAPDQSSATVKRLTLWPSAWITAWSAEAFSEYSTVYVRSGPLWSSSKWSWRSNAFTTSWSSDMVKFSAPRKSGGWLATSWIVTARLVTRISPQVDRSTPKRKGTSKGTGEGGIESTYTCSASLSPLSSARVTELVRSPGTPQKASWSPIANDGEDGRSRVSFRRTVTDT